MITAFRADQRTFGAAVPAGANLFHAVFAKSAFGAIVAVTADAVKTGFTVGAQHIVGTVFALFSAFLTDDRTSGTAASAHADVVRAHFTECTFITKAALTACTAVASSAFNTNIAVCAVFAIFTAFGTDVGAFRTARTAGTDNIHAILTILTFRAIVTLAAYAVKADPAAETKLVAGALRAFLIAIFTAKGTFRTAVTTVADPVGTFDTDITVRAVCFIADAVAAFLTFAADPVTPGAFFAAFLADRFAHFVASAAFVLALAAFKAEFAVVAQTAIFHTLTAFSAVVFAVAVSVGSFTAVIPVVAFPVVITISAAEFAFYTVLIIRIYRNGKQ